ncbi:hypothetical protein [Streptomyces sp. UG1]|uniref:hypothetical protein n=1 Tax=Streptomyces sp. UG1 TaxID=3417652 RepID=UPI003CFA86C9
MSEAITAVGAATLATMTLTSGTAAADSGIRWLYEDYHRCGGQWISSSNTFRLKDAREDHFSCYIPYSFKADHRPESRVALSADVDRGWHKFPVANPEGDKWVFFRVCHEVISGPDNCLDWKRYRT